METIKHSFGKYLPHGIFLVIALAVTGPFFLDRGFVFLLDMVWGPTIQLSDLFDGGVPAHLPLLLIFKLFSLFLSTALIQKLLLTFVLWSCGFGMYTLSKWITARRWAVLSGVFYMLNPYVFERFLAGQWLVLLGYAYFPLVVYRFLRLLKDRDKKSLLSFALAFGVYPIVSLHWTYISFWFLLLAGAVHFFVNGGWQRSKGRAGEGEARRALRGFVVVASCWLVINAFWLADFFSARGILGKIGGNDFEAFRTQADGAWGVFFNVLSLYGFWQDSVWVPKDNFPLWWALTLVILLFSWVGFHRLAKAKSPLALTVAFAFVPALLIGVGHGSPATTPLCELLFRYVPAFGGLRETEKVVGVLAFSYALFFPLGVKSVMEQLAAVPYGRYLYVPRGLKGVDLSFGAAAMFVVVVCSLGVNNMFWGFGGQVRAHEYPASWGSVEKIIAARPGRARVLFLPWHGYPVLDFAGAVTVANPARAYFSADVVAGKNLDSAYLNETAQAQWDEVMFELIQGVGSLDDHAEFFAREGVGYIILAKTSDWQRYGFLEEAKGWRKIYDSGEIEIITNN